jgi:hypothetical protein
MKFIQGTNRNQTEFFCLDQAVSDDNEVRLIDLFTNFEFDFLLCQRFELNYENNKHLLHIK